MSTRLSDLTQYREWQGYGTGYPKGIYTIPAGAMKNFTGCESSGLKTSIYAFDFEKYSREHPAKPQAATAPTVTYSRYCHGCQTVVHSPEPFDRVYCENCKASESMTLVKAVEVLNEHRYDTGGWEVMEHGKFATN